MELLNLAKYVERSYEEYELPDGYVQYGEDNLYPQYLVGLYNSSATHGALCNTIAQMFAGTGLLSANTSVITKLSEWNSGEELPKCALDLKIQGGFALEVRWSLDRSTISNVRHLPFENLRSGLQDIDERVRHYYYSTNWEEAHHPDHTPQKIRSFHVDDKEEHPLQVLVVRPFSVGSQYYPKPDYIGSVNYVELEKSISEFHINNIRNGLSPSFHIAFKNGQPAIEERERIRRDIEMQMSGSQNAGKFIITYSDDPDRKPDFEPFPLSDADKQFEFLSTETTDKIMVGHRVVSPAMFGVKTAGELGNTEELQIASQLFDRQVVAPARMLLCNTFKRLLSDAGMPSDVRMESASPFLPKEEKQKYSATPKYDLEWLLSKGEEVDDSEYELVDERPVDYELEDKRDILTKFAKIVPDSAGGSTFDTPLFKVRYIYDGDNPKDNSREFCVLMKRANKVFKREDIEQARGSIAEMSSGHDIWLHKGGVNCYHFWTRRTYLKRTGRKISDSNLRSLLNDLDAQERRANEIADEQREVGIAPRDMGMTNF